jgi:hypothetical protein
MRSQEELDALHREAEAEFKKLPGVVGVAYGYKLVGGKLTDRLCFRVYVREKKGVAELSPDEVIPPEFKGVPTDVVKLPTGRLFQGCVHMGLDGPLISGITITNLKPGALGIGVGTLGFFATINRVSGPDNVVYVTNSHVLVDGGGAAGNPVYRPKINASGQIVQNESQQRGVIHKEGTWNNVSFAYPGETTPLDYWVDAGTVRIDICMSSWCNTNCGTEFRNEVRGFHIIADPANNILADNTKSISGVQRLTQANLDEAGDYVVYKVGRETGLTVGRVTALRVPGSFASRPGVTAEGMIEITATRPDCDGTGTATRFAFEGDSGAALLNTKRELIGIIVGGPDADPDVAWACHIHPALKELDVTPITDAAPHPAEESLSDAPGRLADPRPNHTPELRARVSASPRGREILDLVEEHRDEIVRLVNHRRPVTVAWHRAKGPAFLGHAVEGVRDPAHVLPREIDGVTRRDLLENMRRALDAHGSAALREALARHAPQVLAHAELLDNPHQILEHLDRREEP